jgi:hypothetical protein
MCAHWAGKYNPNYFVDDIKAVRKVDADGEVSFRGPDIDHVLAVMFSALELEVPLAELEKQSLVRDAVFSAAKRADMTAGHLLAEASRIEKAYAKRRRMRYTLLSSLSIKHVPNLRSRTISDAEMRFSRNRPIQFDRSPLKNRLYNFVPSSKEKQFIIVRATLLARTPLQATERALDAMDLWRAIWNLYLNLCSTMRFSSGRKQPVNQIRYGQIHTLHKPSGKLATDSFWYEPEYVDPFTVKDLRKPLPKLLDFERWVRQRLRGNPHKLYLENALRRYVRALDENKMDNAFLKLWAMLEHLTGTLGESYDRTIRRTVFRYKDRDYERQVLEHLRDHRNRAVHHLESSEQSETLVYQLKTYVENLLVFHIRRLRTFDTLDECWMFLDSTRDHKEIERKLRVNKRARRLIEKLEE